MNIVICASMSFSKEVIEIKKVLERNGHSVLIPERAEEYAAGKLKIEEGGESIRNKIDYDLIRDYYFKIKDSDIVIIANYDKNNIKNYIGGNSFLEAGFAHVLDKKLYFLYDIPKMIYSDELFALKPTILNGDLSSIK